MTPRLLRRMAAGLLLVVFSTIAPVVSRPPLAIAAESTRTLPKLRPFLEVFLAQAAPVVAKPVQWVSAVGKHQGLLTREVGNTRLPGLLLITKGRADDFSKISAHELAGIGYVVLLVELNQRSLNASAADHEQGGDEVRRERTLAKLSAAVRWLRRRDDVFPDRIGALGWGDAAHWALETAAAGGLQAVVLTDPPLPLPLDADLTAGLRHTAVLIVRGAADLSLLDGEYLAKLQRTFENAHVEHRVLEFEQAKAGFMNKRRRDVFDAAAAEQAWFHLYEHFGKHVEDAPLKALLAARSSESNGQPWRHFSSIADLMRAVNTPSGVRGVLAQSLANEPQKKKDWQLVRARAALLADSGELLLGLKPPSGSLPGWRRSVALYYDAATAIAVAADQRDYSAARRALDRLGESCGKCHLNHR